MSNERRLQQVIDTVASTDGDGVQIRRIAGRQWNGALDPYLLIDEIRSADGADYIGGFPPHPHRGFETITYMLDGAMRHRDHLGNEGVIRDGDVQWMTAGRGVIHSEMPEQRDGLLHGFQIWLNLPAADKMLPADYHDLRGDDLPVAALPGGGRLKIIAGAIGTAAGQVGNALTTSLLAGRRTRPLILDVELQPGERWSQPIATGRAVLLRVFAGATTELGPQQLGVYAGGNELRVTAGENGARALLLSGQPLGEPVWQHGPFVMNTREQIDQAIADYTSGRLVA